LNAIVFFQTIQIWLSSLPTTLFWDKIPAMLLDFPRGWYYHINIMDKMFTLLVEILVIANIQNDITQVFVKGIK